MAPVIRLSTDMVDRLRDLDPVDDEPVVDDAELTRLCHAVMGNEQRSVSEILDQAASPRPRRAARWAPVAAVAIVVAVVAVLIVVRRHPSRPSTAGQLPESYRHLAQRTNPLSAGMHVECQGVSVPVAILAAPGGAERGTSAASTALRQFLAHNPFATSGFPVSGHNWLLLEQTPQTLVFARRVGPVGVDAVVRLTRQGGGYTATGLGGCGHVIAGDGQQGEGVRITGQHGRTLSLVWENGSCDGPGTPPDREVARVLLDQSPTAVHILLLSKLSPAGARRTKGDCLGVGLTSTTTVRLTAPLERRALIDDAVVPGSVVPARR